MLSPILSVHSIEASINFYVEALGFEEGFRMSDDNKVLTFAMVKFAEAEILLGPIDGFVDDADRHHLGIGIQLYLEVPKGRDIDLLYQQALDHHANITRTIETREWGERAFNVKDPDGYHLMFAQRP